MTVHIGIDPGLSGYVCAIDDTPGTSPFFWPTPVVDDGFDIPKMVTLAKLWRQTFNPQLVVIEAQQAFPGKGPRCGACGKPRQQQGVASTFQTGLGYGVWLAALFAAGFDPRIVKAQEWKGPLGLDADKKKSIAKAQALFPGADFRPLERAPKSRVPDHNKAEAALLAITARRLAKRELV